MYHVLGMNEVDGGDEFSRDATGFVLGEMFLAANTIEQLAAGQQLHDDIDMKLTKPAQQHVALHTLAQSLNTVALYKSDYNYNIII